MSKTPALRLDKPARRDRPEPDRLPAAPRLEHVSLHYDSETNNIAIALPTWTGRIYNVQKFGRRGRLRVIRAKRFLNHFALQIDQTLTFTQIHQHPGPTLILNLGTAEATPPG